MSNLAEVYIDESSHTGHHYLVIGGIIADHSESQNISDSFAIRRCPELPHGTLKWTKVSKSKFIAYKRVVDFFFDFEPIWRLDFHSLVVDTHFQKHGIWNEGSREIGFNKEIYQLAMKFGPLYPDKLFHIYPDRRTTDQSTDDLRRILNLGIKKHYNDKRDWPFRRVHFREPEDSQILQMADVLSGAIAWALNGHENRPNASKAKTDLSRHILARANINNVFIDTSIYGKFTVWHRRLK